MIDITKGRYWDLPWSLVSGCTPCSPGCERCWSAAMTKRFKPYVIEGDMAMPLITDDGQRFNGRIITHPERLSAPLKRKKPTVYAIWNDWCHDAIDHVFRHKMVIGAEFSEQHTFLALTKRPHVMLDFWQSGIQHVPANWWNGLTVCNQEEADAKIPVFLKVPGKKFLSIEPLLGPVDLEKHLLQWQCPGCREWNYGSSFCDSCGSEQWENLDAANKRQINAVILGGENGQGARPMRPDWVRSVRDQCEAAGVPFFFKGWGKQCPDNEMVCTDCGERKFDFASRAQGGLDTCGMCGTTEWESSRLLDGRTHDELPWVKT